MMQRDTQLQMAVDARAALPARQVRAATADSSGGAAGPACPPPAILPRNQAGAGDTHEQGGTGVVVEKARPKTRRPPLYRVVLHNDDYTPMEFVVEVLLHYFSVTHEQAVQIMLTVHTRGKGVAGTYTRQIAETKVAQVSDHARAHQHPLLCTMEQA